MRNILLALLLLTASASAQKSYILRFDRHNDSFAAEGKWDNSDIKIKETIPSDTEIDCFKDSKLCVEATSQYYFGHPHVLVEYLDIIKWGSDQIIAVSSGLCLNRTLLISIPDKTISDTESSKTIDKSHVGLCKLVGSGGTQSVFVFVVKGSKRWNTEQ